MKVASSLSRSGRDLCREKKNSTASDGAKNFANNRTIFPRSFSSHHPIFAPPFTARTSTDDFIFPFKFNLPSSRMNGEWGESAEIRTTSFFGESSESLSSNLHDFRVCSRRMEAFAGSICG